MIKHQLSDTDSDLWQRFVEAERAYTAARAHLLTESTSPVSVVRAGLDQPQGRSAALQVAASLPLEQRRELLADLLALAVYVHGLTREARKIILSLPREWLRANIEAYAEPILAHEDYEEYRGLLELYSHIGSSLTLRLAQRAAEHQDPDIREAGEDYIANPAPHRPLV